MSELQHDAGLSAEGNTGGVINYPDSRWVLFRRKRIPPKLIARQDEQEIDIGIKEAAVIGTQFYRRVRSKYVGFFLEEGDRPGSKRVYPVSESVEGELEKLEKQNPLGPWLLPVFVYEKDNFRAYQLDAEMYFPLREQQNWSDRVPLIEKIAKLEREVNRLKKQRLPERTMIVVDYQNLSNALNDRKVRLNLDDIIDIICLHANEGVRRTIWLVNDQGQRVESLVYVFDFRIPFHADLYDAWTNRGFKFIEVEPIESGENPTDDVILETARKNLEKYKDTIDTFCLVSGDRAFLPLLHRARALGKETMVAQYTGVTAQALYVASTLPFCDLERYFPTRRFEGHCTCPSGAVA